MEFVTSDLLFNLGNTHAASVSWISDSTVQIVSAPGVGQNLTVTGLYSGVPLTFEQPVYFSYPAPISSDAVFNGTSSGFATIDTGSTRISMVGSFFSSSAASQSLRFVASACLSSSWKSDTMLLCRSPATTATLTLPSFFVVTVALLSSNLSVAVSFVPPHVNSMQTGSQHHSTGSMFLSISLVT